MYVYASVASRFANGSLRMRLLLLISAPRLGVYYFCGWLCASVHPSVCHGQTSNRFFFFCFSMESSHFLAVSSPRPLLQNVVLRFFIYAPNAQHLLPKIACDNAIFYLLLVACCCRCYNAAAAAAVKEFTDYFGPKSKIRHGLWPLFKSPPVVAHSAVQLLPEESRQSTELRGRPLFPRQRNLA